MYNHDTTYDLQKVPAAFFPPFLYVLSRAWVLSLGEVGLIFFLFF